MKNYKIIVSINNDTTELINCLSEYCNLQHIIIRVETLNDMYVIEVSSRSEDKYVNKIMNKLKEADTNGRH